MLCGRGSERARSTLSPMNTIASGAAYAGNPFQAGILRSMTHACGTALGALRLARVSTTDAQTTDNQIRAARGGRTA